ncbi:hypothetical protein OAF87_04130 [Akkermansiaceae bacterium]|nr:hypothetical protein [Akkermansiaceae bacterium]MDB4311704.1 hypothetical protein [bacterium]MDB4740990.1 hypothetical protein [Akkermansiaceae bacterium]MDB4800577.1 hypothetical protein [bacterium]
MARSINVEWKGKESSFSFAKLDRSKLYGKKRRIPVDRDGHKCDLASIDVATGTLLRSGMTAQGYFSSAGEWIPNSELVGLDADGKEIEKVPSTLGVAQKAEQAKLEDLLDLRVDSVYALEPAEVDKDIAGELESGVVFTIPFNYRADYQSEHGYLLHNKQGFFLLVGQPVATEWVSFENKPIADDDIQADDDLDFEMF